MGRDVTAFRKRFEDYKNGKSISEIYDAGLPRYESGKWSYTPSKKVRNHIAKWEGSDFAIQNESFGGDAIGAKAKEFTNTMKPIGANLTQDELDGLFATFYNVAPRTYEREFLPAVTNYANNKTWETQAAMDTALRNRYMLSKKIYQKGIKRRAAADVDLMGLSLQQPIQEEVPVSTAVRPVIKEEKTVPAYDTTISPYISGKPMVKLRPRVQLPNLIELMEDSEWEPGFPGLKNGKLPTYENGNVAKSRRARAIYNSIDPRQAYPESYSDAAKMEANVRWKMAFGNPDQIEYERGQDIGSRVSDAAWRKRLGYDYDESILPAYDGGVRLPLEVEQEIPVDTTFLKDRIKRTEELMNYSRKYRNNKYIKLAKRVDQEALDALRKTYKTGQPVVVNEHAFNNRQWVGGGEVNATMSPLNVLQNYTIQYDPKTNTMKYYDTYDFNQYDWAVPGSPFKISGSIDLKPRKTK